MPIVETGVTAAIARGDGGEGRAGWVGFSGFDPSILPILF